MAQAATAAERLGAMPEWNLTDLYTDMSAPAIAADLALGADMSV